MEFAVAVFTLAAALILIGLVGGDLSFRGLRVPKVGRLPRFTTTLSGGFFAVLAVIIWAAQIDSGASSPGQQVDPAPAPASSPGALNDAGTTTATPPQRIAVRIRDSLTRGAEAETIDLAIDGEVAGTLECTAAVPEDEIDLALYSGSHVVSLDGIILLPDGEQIEVSGSESITADPGSIFAITVDENGVLGLAADA